MDELAKAFLAAGPGGLIAATLFYFYRERASEITALKAKIDQLQTQIVGMLQAQIDSEPKRRDTLDALKRLIEDQSAMLKGKLT